MKPTINGFKGLENHYQPTQILDNRQPIDSRNLEPPLNRLKNLETAQINRLKILKTLNQST